MNATEKFKLLEQDFVLKLGTSLGVSSSDSNQTKDVLYQLTKKNLDSIIYILHHDMLYETMNVLEYLMFASRHQKKTTRKKQRELLDLLTSVGLDYICLTPIRLLTSEEKMVVLLFIALYSKKSYVIFDITDYEFDMSLIYCMKELILRLKTSDTTLILGTMQPKLIGICMEDTLFLHENQIRYYGSVHELHHSMDRVLYVINHSEIETIVTQLENAFPMYEIGSGNNLVFIMRKDSSQRDDTMFFTTLAKEGIVPDSIKINHGHIENSFQELIEFNAILE